MIMKAESLRPIGPAAEYGPYGACITSFEQRGVGLYVCTIVQYNTQSLHPCRIYACTCIVQNIQTSGTS